MRTTTSLALIAVGAILAYAVDLTVPGVDLGVLGTILVLVGILGLLLTVGLELARRRPPAEAAPAPRLPADPAEAPTRVAPRPRARG
jgi:uncharacterized YccA/Bax inhibitor family protein